MTRFATDFGCLKPQKNPIMNPAENEFLADHGTFKIIWTCHLCKLKIQMKHESVSKDMSVIIQNHLYTAHEIDRDGSRRGYFSDTDDDESS